MGQICASGWGCQRQEAFARQGPPCPTQHYPHQKTSGTIQASILIASKQTGLLSAAVCTQMGRGEAASCRWWRQAAPSPGDPVAGIRQPTCHKEEDAVALCSRIHFSRRRSLVPGPDFFSDCWGWGIGRESLGPFSAPCRFLFCPPHLPRGVKAPEGLETVPGKMDLIKRAAVGFSSDESH